MSSVVPMDPQPDGNARRQPSGEGGQSSIAVFGRDRRLMFLSDSQFHPAPADLIGQAAADLSLLGDGPELDRVLQAVMDSGVPQRIEIPTEVDRRTAWLELHVLPLGPSREDAAVLVVGRDVTEAKQAALELRMTVNALHRSIEAREQLEADLHDGTLQSLFGVGLQLEAARAALTAPGAEAAIHLDRALGQIRATMAEIRRYIASGSGAAPASVRWDEALTGLLRGLEVDGGPRIDLQLDRLAIGRAPVAARNEIAFIAREAVSNAVRHAGAARIAVRLRAAGERIRLEIEDDGTGFSPGPGHEGLGLLTMTRRAAQIGGSLTVQTGLRRGSLIRLDLPVAHDGRGGDDG